MIIYDENDNILDIIHDNAEPHPLDEAKLDEALKAIDNERGNEYFMNMEEDTSLVDQNLGQIVDSVINEKVL